MRHLDSEALAAFIAVADFGSFTAAADELSKTQAAISLTIARLEDRLERRLFDRTRRRVTLTSAGERLMVYARQIKALEAEALMAVADKVAESRVRLGMPDDYIACMGEALIQRFSTVYRNIHIDLQCRFSRTLEQMIDNCELDIAIITQNPANPKGAFLRHEKQFWCTGPNAIPEKEECLQLALFSEDCPARGTILSCLKEVQRPWTLAYSASHLAGVQLAAASGRMLTVLPEPAIPAGWRRLGPEDGLPELPPLPLAILTSRSDRLPTRQVAAFLEREFGEPAARDRAAAAAATA